MFPLEPIALLATLQWGEDVWSDTFIVADPIALDMWGQMYGFGVVDYQVVDLAFSAASVDLRNVF